MDLQNDCTSIANNSIENAQKFLQIFRKTSSRCDFLKIFVNRFFARVLIEACYLTNATIGIILVCSGRGDNFRSNGSRNSRSDESNFVVAIKDKYVSIFCVRYAKIPEWISRSIFCERSRINSSNPQLC